MSSGELERARWNISFAASKSMRYHAYRRSFWEGIDYLSKIITIISGTAVLVSIIGNDTFVAKITAFIVSLSSASDIIFGFSQKAKRHDDLYRRFSLLAQNISMNLDPTPLITAEWSTRRLEIEMDEPGILDWLERRCAAEEALARGSELDDRWKLKWFQVLFSQIAMWPTLPKSISSTKP